MSYRTHCDWCGKSLTKTRDKAELSVTIHHWKSSQLLSAWAEETRPTLHFCAAPVEEVDHTGTNRMGLAPEEHASSCYDRALATLTGTELRDPGMGLEWRLVPVGDTQGTPPRRRAGQRLEDVWRRTPREVRESLLFGVLGDERLLIREIAERLNAEVGPVRAPYRAVYDGDARHLVMRMFRAGRLDREPETFSKTKTRYRYSRRPQPAAEIVGRDISIGELEISERTYRALQRAQITSLVALQRSVRDRSIVNVKGLGEKGLAEIETALDLQLAQMSDAKAVA